MSMHTKRALEAAVAAHLADECDDAYLTGYVIQIVGIEPLAEHETSEVYLTAFMDSLPYHAGVGLSQMLGRYFDASFVYGPQEEDHDL